MKLHFHQQNRIAYPLLICKHFLITTVLLICIDMWYVFMNLLDFEFIDMYVILLHVTVTDSKSSWCLRGHHITECLCDFFSFISIDSAPSNHLLYFIIFIIFQTIRVNDYLYIHIWTMWCELPAAHSHTRKFFAKNFYRSY